MWWNLGEDARRRDQARRHAVRAAHHDRVLHVGGRQRDVSRRSTAGDTVVVGRVTSRSETGSLSGNGPLRVRGGRSPTTRTAAKGQPIPQAE
jgi:hypothetical protein